MVENRHANTYQMNLDLARYRCYKVVGAAKILSHEHHPGYGVAITLDIEGAEPWIVTEKWWNRHYPLELPQSFIGGYLVQYDDGYLSFSPKAVFEAGYSLLSDTLDPPGSNNPV